MAIFLGYFGIVNYIDDKMSAYDVFDLILYRLEGVMKYTEVISRIYNSLAIIEYEKVNREMVLIHNIKSSSESASAEQEALEDFVKEFKAYDILVDITRLAGHRKSIVEHVGFIAIFDGNLPVFATHKLARTI